MPAVSALAPLVLATGIELRADRVLTADRGWPSIEGIVVDLV